MGKLLSTALRWNHIINNKLFMNTTAAYTRYRFNMDIGTTDVEKKLAPPQLNHTIDKSGVSLRH